MTKEELQVGICDDKAEDIDLIEAALHRALKKTEIPVRLVCHKFTDGESMYEICGKETFHLLFLDIEMPGLDGFGLASKLCTGRRHVYVVFVSAHNSFVYDSFAFAPLWFVRKEMLDQDMCKAVKMYFQETASRRISYRLESGFGIHNLLIRDIIYIEGSGHNLAIQMVNGDRMGKYGSLKAMEEELAGYHFLRIHKNFLVNQCYIKEVGKREIYLLDGNTLEMGRDRRATIRMAMLQYEGECHGI